MRASRVLAASSFWETPLFEQVPFFRYWKAATGNGAQFAQDLPRTVNGFIESNQPKQNNVLRWYPYRQELAVDNVLKPTITDAMRELYFPKMLSDDERIVYCAAKTGRSEEELASELFQMRRLRLALCQSLRDKLKGKWYRQPLASWTPMERQYLEASISVAQAFGMDFYCCDNYDPYLIYSPYHELGDCCDMVFHKQLRTTLQFLFVEVCVHQSIPRARLPNVKGMCKAPLQDVEPCLLEMIKLKLSALAVLSKQEQYVVDHPWDTNHKYHGAIIHFYKTPDGEVTHVIEPLELDLPFAQDWLKHYYATYIGPKGNSKWQD